MRIRVFTLTSDPEGGLLDDLVDAALEYCDRLGLMMQPRNNFAPAAEAVLDALQPALIGTEEVEAWPGSQLHDGSTATRLVYRWSPETAAVFRSTAASLYAWVNPDLPEDPHLLRPEGSVWMGSTTSEDDAWLELIPEEKRGIDDRHPRLASALRAG